MAEVLVEKYNDEICIKKAKDEIVDYLTLAMNESKGGFIKLRRKL